MEIQRKPIAFISDVYGNLQALDAVLQETKEQNISSVYAIGNLVFGGDQPLEVWKKLQDAHVNCLRGPTDRALGQFDLQELKPINPEDQKKLDAFKKTHAEIGELVVQRLFRLPDQIRLPLWDGSEMVIMHGSPVDPLTEITQDMSEEEIMALIGDDPADIFVCSGAHVQFSKTIDDVTIIGLGSAGKPIQDPTKDETKWVPLTIVTPQMAGPQIDQRWLEIKK